MPTPPHLLSRLDDLARVLAARPEALALLGLGSVGQERERLDTHSDLDFFVIVVPGTRAALLEDLSWLHAAHPVAFSFANTPDGRKALFEDGVFAEYAVFEPDGLAGVAYAPGRFVWKRPEVPEAWAVSRVSRPADLHDLRWHTLEALTNLFVGLHRAARGERLSAARFIQGYAVDRVLAIAALERGGSGSGADPFSPERRFEQRCPDLVPELARMVQGYGHDAACALHILAWLEQRGEVPARLAGEIRALAR